MNITKKQIPQQETTILYVEGRLDTTTSAEFSEVVSDTVEHNEKVVLDMEKVIYVSSSGLRALLNGVKKANTKGKAMVLTNVQDTVMEVFTVTGFSDILTIEA